MVNKLDYSSLDKNYYKLMLIKRVLFVMILFVAYLLYKFVSLQEWFTSKVFFVGLGILLIFAILYVWLTKVFFTQKKYSINEKNVTYRSGVLFQSTVIVPFSRIQHIEIDEGPFERYLGLTALSIYTAGDSGKDLLIKGLKIEKALEIKEFITSYIKNE